MSIDTIIDEHGLVPVADIFSSEGYDWSNIAVFYKPDARRFFWNQDGGCSCYGPGEYVDNLGDLEDGNRAAAIEALRSFSPYDEHDMSRWTDEKEREIRKVRNFRYVAPETD